MNLAKHIWLALTQPWPLHLENCAFCSKAAPQQSPEIPDVLADEDPESVELVFMLGRRRRGQ